MYPSSIRKTLTTCILLVFSLVTIAQKTSSNPLEWRQGKALTVSFKQKAGKAPVVRTAFGMVSRDLQQVLGATIRTGGKADIIVSQDAKALNGRKEAFRMEVKQGRLHITGNDAHGVAYGLLELSRLMGVSPWEWWADAKPSAKQVFSLPADFVSEQAPSVEYRGIFINDEDWGLMPWACQTYEPGPKGQIGPKTNERIFELMLRLRANTYWPAMHECTRPFFLTEGNREVAERYGIYIGGSHCEPMASSTAVEWKERGKGEYDYVNNSEAVGRFWEERVKEVARQPILYTVGMRGVHDGAMKGAKTIADQKAVLEKVIADQRQLLSRHVDKDVTRVPQVFIPYKEVLDVYHAGLQVPDDICLMWTDDNYGYIRHFPTEAERARTGGNGIYYHVSYWGRPHDYLWLGTFSPALLYHQMNTAYDQGIQKIWILNVGDIKPIEYQIELMMDMAWDIQQVRKEGVGRHLQRFLAREFGEQAATDLLPVMLNHYRLAFIHKPEFMGGTRTEEKDRNYWNTVRDLPWDSITIANRLTTYQQLEDEVERIGIRQGLASSDCYYQLVAYPVKAAAEMNKKYLYAQQARHGMADWLLSDRAHDSIISLTRRYNEMNGGKWQRMMDCQPRRLPVFNAVPHQADAPTQASASHVGTTLSSPHSPLFLQRWNGSECSRGQFSHCEELGYEGKAAMVEAGQSIFFDFDGRGCCDASDSILVEVSLLPYHPIGGSTLRLQVSIDQNPALIADYATRGRSEEWKENVLWNRATRRFRFPIRPGKQHTIELKAIDQGIVIDQVNISAME